MIQKPNILTPEIQQYLQQLSLELLYEANPLEFSWRSIFPKNLPPEFNFVVKLKNKDFYFQEDDKHPYQPTYLYYKNLNIPNIIIQKEQSEFFKQNIFSKNFSRNKNIVAEIQALRFEMGNMYTSPLKGSNVKQMNGNSLIFKKLKFTETSYKRSRSRFFLIIAISEIFDNGRKQLQELYLSPPIFLESRRKTYAERIINGKPQEGEVLNRFGLYDYFLPHLILIEYEKGLKCKETVENITNDINGLIDYLASPIIRNKIFHPLFLLWKFSNAVQLFYNSNLISLTPQKNFSKHNDEFFITIFKEIYRSIQSSDQQKYEKIENKPLILTLQMEQNKENKSNMERISKYLKNLQGPVLQYFSYNFKDIPKNFKELKYQEEHKIVYKRVYPYISNLEFQRLFDGEKKRYQKKVEYHESETQYCSVINASFDASLPQNDILIKIPIQKQSKLFYDQPYAKHHSKDSNLHNNHDPSPQNHYQQPSTQSLKERLNQLYSIKEKKMENANQNMNMNINMKNQKLDVQILNQQLQHLNQTSKVQSIQSMNHLEVYSPQNQYKNQDQKQTLKSLQNISLSTLPNTENQKMFSQHKLDGSCTSLNYLPQQSQKKNQFGGFIPQQQQFMQQKQQQQQQEVKIEEDGKNIQLIPPLQIPKINLGQQQQSQFDWHGKPDFFEVKLETEDFLDSSSESDESFSNFLHHKDHNNKRKRKTGGKGYKKKKKF